MNLATRFDWSGQGAYARLVALWGAGLTASACALALTAEFGGELSRDAVLGQVRRHKIVRDVPAVAAPTVPLDVPEPAPAPEPAPVWLTSPEDGEAALPEAGYRLEDVPLYGCKWPVTKHLVAAADHRFCGARARTGKSYCAHHHGIAYRPARPE